MSVGFFYNHRKRYVLSGEKLLYHGTWNEKPVVFDRMFRGHLFTLEECQALCDGEMFHVYGLSRGNASYGVFGGLVEPSHKQMQDDALFMEFKVFDVLVDRDDYDFAMRDIVYLRDYQDLQNQNTDFYSGFTTQGLPVNAALAGSVLDDFSDVYEAKLSGMLSQITMPAVKETRYIVHDNIRVFVPVYPGVPGYDPDYDLKDQEDQTDFDQVSADEEEPGVLVGGFSLDVDTGNEEIITADSEAIAVNTSVETDSAGSDRMDDFADLAYLDDPLADPEYDPDEAELDTDYDEE